MRPTRSERRFETERLRLRRVRLSTDLLLLVSIDLFFSWTPRLEFLPHRDRSCSFYSSVSFGFQRRRPRPAQNELSETLFPSSWTPRLEFLPHRNRSCSFSSSVSFGCQRRSRPAENELSETLFPSSWTPRLNFR